MATAEKTDPFSRLPAIVKDTFANRVAENIRRLCIESGWDAAEFFKKAKLKRPSGYRLLNGISAEAAAGHIEALAALFGVDMSELAAPTEGLQNAGTLSKAGRKPGNRRRG